MTIKQNAYHSKFITEKVLEDGVVFEKHYKNSEGLNEIKVYEEILQHDELLLAPKLISSSEENLILTIGKYTQVSKIDSTEIDQLQDWLIYKYSHFKQSNLLLDKGLNIKRYNKPKVDYLLEIFPKGIVPEILSNQKLLALMIPQLASLPFTLSHGDIRRENILLDDKHNIVICDWVLASISNGLIDTFMFLELVRHNDPESYGERLNLLENSLQLQNLECLVRYEGLLHYLSEIQYFSLFLSTNDMLVIHGKSIREYIDECILALEYLWERITHDLKEERI